MPDISIHNETEYNLTDAIKDQVKRDALEYFGESVRVIRVQYGIERHAFNAKTGEMRFAFSPSDYGIIDTSLPSGEIYYQPTALPELEDEPDEIITSPSFEDDEVEIDEEDEEENDDDVTSHLASLDDDLDDSDEEDEDLEFQSIEEPFEDDDDNDLLYEDEDYN